MMTAAILGITLMRAYVRLGGQETLRQMGVTGVASAMSGFGDILNEEEIEAILDFIKSNWSP